MNGENKDMKMLKGEKFKASSNSEGLQFHRY